VKITWVMVCLYYVLLMTAAPAEAGSRSRGTSNCPGGNCSVHARAASAPAVRQHQSSRRQHRNRNHR